MNDLDWKLRGKCATSKNPDLWFPAGRSAFAVAPAAVQCAVCPVRERCAEYADANDEQHGVWAGRLRRRRRQAVAA